MAWDLLPFVAAIESHLFLCAALNQLIQDLAVQPDHINFFIPVYFFRFIILELVVILCLAGYNLPSVLEVVQPSC